MKLHLIWQTFLQSLLDIRQGAVIVVLLAVAGCASPHGLSADKLASLRIDEVRVVIEPAASIWWGDGERAFARSKGLQSGATTADRTDPDPDPSATAAAYDAVVNTPEGKSFVRAEAGKVIESGFRQALKLRGGTGNQPARVIVTVRDIFIASAVQRIIVGGSHRLTLSVDLVDVATGNLIVRRDELIAADAGGQGLIGVAIDQAFEEPLTRLARGAGNTYAGWLFPG